MARGPLCLGVDIGGTKTAVGLIDASGQLLAVDSAPSGRGRAEVVAVAARLVEQVRAAAEPALTQAGGVAAVGACMPGIVDTATGFVRHAVNLDVDDLDLAGALAVATGLPVRVDNDVKAAALGANHVVAARDGVGHAHGTLAYLNLGTGMAAAIVRDGVVDRGAGGVAGEIGHIPVKGLGRGFRCGCGQLGCLETVASGAAFRRQWAGGDPFEAAKAGDASAALAIENLAHGVSLATQILVVAAGADRVVIGGGLSNLGEPLAEAIRRAAIDRAAESEFLRELDLGHRFELLPPGTPAGVIGAAFMSIDRVEVG